jgi:nucleoside-diphosphate-sugar epimerase
VVAQSAKRVLITGSGGQIGSELTVALRQRHGASAVVATDIRPVQASCDPLQRFETLDVRDRVRLDELVRDERIDTIYHLAAILSATGEAQPQLAWSVNIDGLVNVLEVARARSVRQVFCPSSIAVFGPETPRSPAPQTTVLRPTTIYGLTKIAGELLGDYYVHRYGLDVRGLRYPGIISSETPPGGGTTDYAVHMFYDALQCGSYTCFVSPETELPMMYMPDCIKATVTLMDADFDRLSRHCDYNVAGMTFSAAELAAEIARHVSGFTCRYEPDFRQAIADSWPKTIDDSSARADWDWSPSFDLTSMTVDMLERLRARRRRPAP